MFHSEIKTPILWRMYAKKIAIATIAVSIAILAWANLFINASCHAATVDNIHLAATAPDFAYEVDGRAERNVGIANRKDSRVSGSIEGKLNQANRKVAKDANAVQQELAKREQTRQPGLIDSLKKLFQ